jgi:hypothetical protein
MIAEELAIGEHTAADYLKKLCRHFGVRSQLALMRRFLVGLGEAEATVGGES